MRAIEAGAPACARLTDGIALALDRRSTGRVERLAAGVRLESKQALARVEGQRLADLRPPVTLAPLRNLLLALGFDECVGAVTQARVPAETGLSAEVAALVASAAAALRLAGDGVGPAPEDVASRAEQALRGDGGVGAFDPLLVWTAIRGGCQRRIGAQVRPVAIDPAWVEQSLLLVDAGVAARPRDDAPGPSPADDALEAALVARDDGAVARLIASAWEATCARDAAAAPASPEAEAALDVARAAGGAGRPCGSGGGGLLLLWLPVDARAGVIERLRQAGRRTYACRVDLLGLDLA